MQKNDESTEIYWSKAYNYFFFPHAVFLWSSLSLSLYFNDKLIWMEFPHIDFPVSFVWEKNMCEKFNKYGDVNNNFALKYHAQLFNASSDAH